MIARRRLTLAAALLVPLAAGAQQDITGPQPELPKEPLVIVTKDGKRYAFRVEVARTPQQQEVGEMFRTRVPEDGGMLFDWGAPQESNMWMRNTLVPLDMLFIGPDGTIRAVAEDAVPRSLAIIQSGIPVRATLEVAGGTARRLGIVVGDKVLNPVFGTGP
jgi:uncharacterized protein